MNTQIRKQVFLLIACVVIIFASAFLAFRVERDFGKVDVQLVRFPDLKGTMLTARLYRPVAATSSQKMPGVLCLHGYQNDKDTQDAFAIELSRRGFVALAMDHYGHGGSGGYLEFAKFLNPAYTMGADAGYQFLKNLPFVDAKNLGIMGHSMGSRTTVRVAAVNPDHKALNPQASDPGTPGLHNVLFTQARFEDMPATRYNGRVEEIRNNSKRLSALGLTGPVEWNVTYGNFADGTARKQALINTTHPGLTHSSTAVAEGIDWMRLGLKNAEKDAYWIPPDQQIFMWKEILTLIALLFTALSMIPLANILLARCFFAEVAQPMPSRYITTGRSWLILALINAFIAGITYPSWTLWGTAELQKYLPFYSLRVANATVVWFVGNAVVYLILFTIWYFVSAKKKGITLYDMGVSFDQQKTVFNWRILGKTLLLGAILFAWMYVLEGISEWALGIEYRFIWGFMRQFDLPRLGLFVLYLLPALAFFLLNGGVFFFGQARQKEYSTPASTQLFWWLKICFAGLFGLLIVWAIMYIPYIFMGTLPGFELMGLTKYSGFWPLMLWIYIPEFVFLLFFLTWFYRRTGRIYLGALVIASLVAWFVAAGSVITG
jgi:pimeloyl-ACP methyl ester carboxylesterase